MTMTEGRKAWLDREKAAHPGCRTSGEVMALLGVSEATWKRMKRDGRAPKAKYTSPSGWPLWSKEQVRKMIRDSIGDD
jgi:predicted DNA-binding transcriptional regulator AlpA